MPQEDVLPAFPCTHEVHGVRIQYAGMSLREWYAGQALVGLVAATQPEIKAPFLAIQAFAIADAMLREGDK